jgi:hypothetical protein
VNQQPVTLGDLLNQFGYDCFFAEYENADGDKEAGMFFYAKRRFLGVLLDMFPASRRIVAEIRPFDREAKILMFSRRQGILKDAILFSKIQPRVAELLGWRVDEMIGFRFSQPKILREISQPKTVEEWFDRS